MSKVKTGFELEISDLNARVLTTTLLSLGSGESSFHKLETNSIKFLLIKKNKAKDAILKKSFLKNLGKPRVLDCFIRNFIPKTSFGL